jgi:[acyl-carrier-protein] S-malonyltransferase
MERVSRHADGAGGRAGMAAVIGLSKPEAEKLLLDMGDAQVFLANHNSPSQVVLSGTQAGLEQAEQVFKKAGARRIIRLRVSGPFHSPLIGKAAEEFASFLKDYTFHDPLTPVYSNVTADGITGGDEAKELCVKQIVSTVRWVDEEAKLLSDGYTGFYEAGPGSVLRGLWKAFCAQYPCHAAGKLEDLQTVQINRK